MTDYFSLLSCERRKNILTVLGMHSEGDTVSARNVSKILATVENQKNIDGLQSEDYKRVYIAMIQQHLPKMADLGVIDYDSSSKEITVTSETLEAVTKSHQIEAVIE